MAEATAPELAEGGTPSSRFPSPLRLLSDERLARRAAKGDGNAIGEIYRRYHQDLYRFCAAMLGNAQDAQDALQNAMVKVVRALPGEERSVKLKPWLYRIARNEAVEVMRKRREGAEVEVDSIVAAEGVAESAESRERLRGLIADLEQLPERQRAALVMREMGGVGFEEIGASFGTSAAVARQTVYEGRLGLREMEAGREMSCEEVTRVLSDADGRVRRRRDVRAHLRACESCRAFRDAIGARRGDFAAIAPLPLAVSAGLLHGLGIGVGKAAAASALAKSAATVAVVATVGVTAADRGGLIDTPLPGGGEAVQREASPAKAPQPRAAAEATGGTQRGASGAPGGSAAGGEAGGKRGAAGAAGAAERRKARKLKARAGRLEAGRGSKRGHGRRRGRPEGLPPAARKGQETAAARKPPQANASPGPPPAPPGQEPGGGAASKPSSPSPSPSPPPAPPAKHTEPPSTAAPPAVDSQQGPQGVGPPAKGA